jgi:hypothetical protein
MAEDQKKGQRARAFDALTTQHLKEALQNQALTLTMEQYREALVAESMTTSHLQASLNSATKDQVQAQIEPCIEKITSKNDK